MKETLLCRSVPDSGISQELQEIDSDLKGVLTSLEIGKPFTIWDYARLSDIHRRLDDLAENGSSEDKSEHRSDTEASDDEVISIVITIEGTVQPYNITE